MFEHNNENAKQVLKGLSNPDSQYRYDNMPCDCSSDKVDEMVRKSERCEPIAHQCIHINELTKRIEELELSLNKHLIFNTEQVERGGKIYNQRIPNIHKLVKRIEELEQKQAELVDAMSIAQCECKQKTEPVDCQPLHYDKDSDVLYLHFSKPEKSYCESVGDYDNINVMRSLKTNIPVGMLIYCFSQLADKLRNDNLVTTVSQPDAEPVTPVEWEPKIGKPCLYSGESYIDAEGIIVDINTKMYEHHQYSEVPYLVYLYEHNIAYWGSRDELKPMPEKE